MILKQFPTDLLGLLNMYLVILAVPYPRTRTWRYLDVSWYVMMVFAMYIYVSMGSRVGGRYISGLVVSLCLKSAVPLRLEQLPLK